jgi:SAM-dependent methyltransferase
LRLVDAATFIDPVVPIDSDRSGGALVKKSLRKASLWYVGWVTHQVAVFNTAVGRALHLIEDQVGSLRRDFEAQRVPLAGIVDAPWASRPDAWWVAEAAKACQSAKGRILHAACGNGWLVRALVERGIDAYGIDPRPGRVDRAELDGSDLREEGVADHLAAIAPAGLGGIVLSGVVDGMMAGERRQLLDLVTDRLAPDGVLLVHSVSPGAWGSASLPPEADLASGRPLQPATWVHLLGEIGFEAESRTSPDDADYLVTARLRDAQGA